MSKHKVIIITPPPGGGNLVADGGTTVTIEWKPGDLTPEQERRRTEWAEKQAGKIVERLNSPAGEEGHIE